MSDTDDTDYLLLIPPDFFLVNLSECESQSTTNLEKDSGIGTAVNFLVHRVEDLSDRLSVMENLSPGRQNDFRNKSLLSHLKDVPSHDSFQIENKYCTTWPLKIDEFGFNGNEKTKKSDLIPFKTSTPYVNSNKMEISKKFNSENENLSSKFNICQVDKLLTEMEKTRNEIKNKLQSNKQHINTMKNHFPRPKQDSEGKPSTGNDSMFKKNKCNSESFYHSSQTRENPNLPENSLTTNAKVNEFLSLSSKQSKALLSISKVMSDVNNVETLQQKLEAEILKRKHCEDLIQQLQLNLLEQEENLTVALRVDAEKEEFIEQLQNGWTQMVEHWKELENQRQELATMLERERVQTRKSVDYSSQKIDELETRLRETYALTTSYEQKNKDLEKSFVELQHSVDNIKAEFEKKINSMEYKNKRLEAEKLEITEQLDYTNDTLLNEKQKCVTAEARITSLEKAMSSLTREKQDLTEKLNEEKKCNDALKSEVAKYKMNYNLATTAEIATTKEINKMKQEMVKIKSNLKEYYQKQLDSVLREKIDEFQKQIQNAEKIMHQELHKQEKLVSDKFQNEIIKLQNAQKLELSEERRINLKHVNILKGELKESRRKIQELEEKLKSETISKEPTKRIQPMMDSQWLDAFHMISGNVENSKDLCSPNSNEKYTFADDSNYNEDSVFENDKISVDLRKYIEMLLEKQPGKPVSSRDVNDLIDKSFDNQKHQNSVKKPPWK